MKTDRAVKALADAATASAREATNRYVLLPHNLEAGQGLLGVLMMEARALDLVSEYLKPKHFSQPTPLGVSPVQCTNAALRIPVDERNNVLYNPYLFLGTLRCACLDFVIPFPDNHLRRLVREWVDQDNAGRPPMSLGPGMPQPSTSLPVALHEHRHLLPEHKRVVARVVLGGLLPCIPYERQGGVMSTPPGMWGTGEKDGTQR